MQNRVRSRNKHLNSNQAGFTFIELLLYVGLVAILVTSAVLFAWDVILGSARANTHREVTHNARLASQFISREIRGATRILSASVQDLCLESPIVERNPVRIYVDGGQLMLGWGGGSTNCTNLTTTEALTNNKVFVSDLVFNDFSVSADAHNIGFEIEISIDGGRPEWQRVMRVRSAAELRSAPPNP